MHITHIVPSRMHHSAYLGRLWPSQCVCDSIACARFQQGELQRIARALLQLPGRAVLVSVGLAHMLTSSAHGLKAAILRTSKEGGRRVEANSSNDGYMLYYSTLLHHTDPTRAITRLHAYLVEGDLRQLWQRAKQKLKRQLPTSGRACNAEHELQQQQQGPSGLVPRATSTNLDHLYGSNGVFRVAIMYVLAHASRGFMTHVNSTSVEGSHHMEAALAREPGRPLITVCNHVASMDDPLVMSTILPPAVYSDPEQLRWTLCASDRCFHREVLVPFFRAAKVLPVERGAGMFQPGLAAAEARLAAGDWVHIFPEGTRSRDGKMGPVRKGVGRLVASCAEARPLIVPFVHSGMQEVLPKGALLPKTNKEVKVLVGEPIDVSDLFTTAIAQGWTSDKLYSSIANRIGGHMATLKARLDGLPLDALHQQQQQQAVLDAGLDLYDPLDNVHRAASLWERVSFRKQHREWSAQGLAAALGGWQQLQQRQQQWQQQQRPLAWVKECLLQTGGSGTDLLSRQRSIEMMQLLQARV